MSAQEKELIDDGKNKETNRFELICAATMAMFAAIGVLSSTYSGITGGGWLQNSQVAAQAYSWYQAKSIKETIIEGQVDFALSLKENLATNPTQTKSIDHYAETMNKQVTRLKNEKNEILKGSKNIDKKEWAQDIEGKLGGVVGAKEWEKLATSFGNCSDYFTYATVYIQISLVIGALSLIVGALMARNIFYISMLGLGLYGTYLSWQGFMLYASLA